MSKNIIKFKSTKGGKFSIELPESYTKIALPYFNEWVTALESGKYRQTNDTLCRIENKKASYCCLGILSKVQGRLVKTSTSFVDENKNGNLSISNPCFGVLKANAYLPTDVLVFKDDTTAYSLVDCNDLLHLSFKDIAKIIKTLYKPE